MLTKETNGLKVVAPFVYGATFPYAQDANVTEAFRVMGDSSTGSADGDMVQIADDRGTVLALTMDQFRAIQALDLESPHQVVEVELAMPGGNSSGKLEYFEDVSEFSSREEGDPRPLTPNRHGNLREKFQAHLDGVLEESVAPGGSLFQGLS